MSWSKPKSFLFPSSIRVAYFLMGVIGVGGVASFAAFMWHVSTIPGSDQQGCRLVALLFIGLTVWSLYATFRNVKTINMRYDIADGVVLNYYGNRSIQINLNSEIIRVRIPLLLYFAKSVYTIDYVALTPSPYQPNRIDTARGIRALRGLWVQGIVVLPKDIESSINN
jgi:hypothetical protein